MYVLDEPTTGLHFEEIRSSVPPVRVETGNTVIVIERDLDVIDW